MSSPCLFSCVFGFPQVAFYDSFSGTDKICGSGLNADCQLPAGWAAGGIAQPLPGCWCSCHSPLLLATTRAGDWDEWLSPFIFMFSNNFKFLMWVKISEHVETATWCLKGLIPPGFKNCLYVQVPCPSALCDTVPAALGAALVAASSSGQPWKVADLAWLFLGQPRKLQAFVSAKAQVTT